MTTTIESTLYTKYHHDMQKLVLSTFENNSFGNCLLAMQAD